MSYIKAYIVETPFGVFGLNEHNQIITKEFFRADPSETADKLIELQNGKLIPELQTVLSKIREQNFHEIVVEDAKLARTLKDLKVTVETPSKIGRIMRSKLLTFMKEFEKWDSEDQIIQYIQQLNILITRRKIKEISEEKDRFIAQAIEAVDDCDKALNIFASRIREWYGLHFPELDKKLPNHISYIKIVGQVGPRTQILTEAFEKAVGFASEKIEKIRTLAKGSMGATITEFEFKPLQNFALITEKFYKLREQIAEYIDDAMKEVAPNIRALVGALLGARLISLAGSLKRLSMMPASTIQVLGAEKALFRSLRTGAKPPKHGIIYQWDEIHGAPYWLKGKIARILAGKLSIATRVDYFSGEYVGENLLTDLNRRIAEIKRKYPKAPKKPKKTIEQKEKKRTSQKMKGKYRKRKKRHKKKKTKSEENRKRK
ncbi:MAG: C/D box methylation guide ribonucleoprotein complex aNOP56 subunit [Candidatus Helarchaeota archaeon]